MITAIYDGTKLIYYGMGSY